NVINGNAFVPKTTGLNKVYWTLGSVTDSATFMVYALPNTKVFRDTITRCSGDSVWISVLGTADTYNWSLLSNPTVSLSNQSLYHIKMPSSSTPYLFTGTANYPGLTCSIKDTLAVIPVPVVADFLDTIDHNRVYFYGIPGAQTYAWEFGDKKFSKDWQQDPVFTYKANGYFNVKLTITTMCSSQKYSVTKSIFIADLLYIDDGIQDISQSDIKVYPNPVVDYVQIQGVREFNQLQIVDIHGKLVDIKQFDKYQDFYYFDLSDYKTGTYIFCFLDAKGNIYTTRVIKQ
ncbi:TPA: hypothetical protein DEP21_05925, partial [Patescibacteria group bacterium]|nr:hypothetical protein [Candidatus Gracilibacteria bacterium]